MFSTHSGGGTVKFDPVEFKYTGGFQIWEVPSGVSKIDVEVAAPKGITGHANMIGQGGLGGKVICQIKVKSKEKLYIYVGQFLQTQLGGLATARYNASDIRTNFNGITDATSLNSRIVVAGAGGNGGCTYNANWGGNGGAGGGLTAGDGGNNSSYGGKGGSQTTGGARGCGGSGCGVQGSFGIGGNARAWSSYLTGGAGGAGWYGGGGGGSEDDDSPYNTGGGGGGSSYTDPNRCSGVTHQQGVINGEGYIRIYPAKTLVK